MPEIERIEPFEGDEGLNLWVAFDESGSLIGYAFAAVVPEVVPDIPDMDEMDVYQVIGILDPKEYKIINIDISLHPDGPDDPWTTEITEPEFEGQYIGLTMEEIDLAPDGKIDAVTDATLSSTWLTDAIRDKVSDVLKRTSGTT